MTTRRLLALPLLTLALLAHGCSADDAPADGETCTVMGCATALALRISPAGSGWSEGSYQLIVTADGQTSTCTFALALPLLDGRAEGWTCDAPLSAHLFGDGTCGGACGRLSVGLEATPGQAQVELRRDGQLVLDQAISPTYQESTPNGPACAPVCQNATVALTIADGPGQRQDAH